jgi:predicted nucleic acid-binding Zn ribbon protein
MQQARVTLQKIFADKICHQAGGEAPLLAWPIACGAAVAEKTRALSFTDGVLVVAVPDAAWRKQLQSMSEQYVTRVAQLAGRVVKGISFVVGPQNTRPTL